MNFRLEVNGLHAGIAEHEILKGLSLQVPAGEVHAIMGPNGSGKSTLANVLMGHPEYEVTGGSALFDGEELLEMPPDERARKGLFLSFQHPVPLPGISLLQLVRNSTKQVLGEAGYESALDMAQALHAAADGAGLSRELLSRAVNDGFSGGEKKKGEVVQMVMQKPRLVILDEIDSGLDIDAVRRVAESVSRMRDEGRSFLIITHYQRILDHVTPDRIHVMQDGQIARSGGPELAAELERIGYGEPTEEVA